MPFCPLAAGAVALAAALSPPCDEPAGAGEFVSETVLDTHCSSQGQIASPCSAIADQPLIAARQIDQADSYESSFLETYFDNWHSRVERSRASQQDWIPPLMTLSPLITELVRWDASYQRVGNGADVLNLGDNKGVFLVPTTTNEVDVGLPTYQTQYGVHPADGLTDWQFLLIKQRLLSANEENGNYILTAALAGQAPVGASAFTNHTYVITPALTGGKGFGNLNIQAETAFAVPTPHGDMLGTAWSTNVTFQYHLPEVFLWPEFEVNWTHWLGGAQRGGKNELFLTFGAIVGPIPLNQALGVTFGAGYQFAVAPEQTLQPVPTPAY